MAETVRKNLGMVTAYAYAVSKGYSGTEEEFAELMASYADVAQDAEASAQAAAQSATTAEQKATQAAGSADDAEAAKDLVLGMNAVANTLPAGSQATASYSNGTLTLGIPQGEKGEKGDTGESAYDQALEGGYTGSETDFIEDLNSIGELKENLTDLQELADTKAAAIYETASGSIASFKDGADDMPMKSAVVTMEPIQNLHGYDSPWPAGGGKNLVSLENPKLTTNTAQILATLTNLTGAYNFILSFDFTNADCQETSAGLFNLSDENENHYILPTSLLRVSDKASWATITKPVTGRFYCSFTGIQNPERLITYFESASYGKWSGSMSNVQLEIGTAPTSYSPYSNICPISGRTGLTVYHSGTDTSDPSTITVNWETEVGTVYGGTLDVTNGVLTVDRVRITFDGSETWQKSGGYSGSFFRYWNNFNPAGMASHAFTCSHAVYHPLNNDYKYGMCASDNSCSLFLMADPNATIEDFKTFLASEYASGTPVQICYNIATPTEIQLTQQEIRTLLGVNNVWSDGGDMAVEYPADTKLYIDQKITEAIAAAMA